MTDVKWNVGDIVQIDPAHDKVFGACFMVVTEPKSWGAQGYFQAPGKDGLAYYRVKFENAIRVGVVEWMPIDVQDEICRNIMEMEIENER